MLILFKFIIKVSNQIRESIPKMSISFLKWAFLSLGIGTAVGLISSLFHLSLKEAEFLREQYPFIILLLPVSGILIVLIYKLLKLTNDKGTNLVLTAVRDGEKMTWRNTLSIFTGSVLTHFCGGSAGREGAALQIGGSVGSQIGLWLISWILRIAVC